MNDRYATEYGDDGTVCYWSVYQQQWQTCHASQVPSREQAQWDEGSREVLREHAEAHPLPEEE